MPEVEPADGGGLPADLVLVFCAPVRSEAQWSEVAEFASRFARAFKQSDGVLLSIAAFGEPRADTIAKRVERIFRRVGIDVESAGYVDISDEDSDESWHARLGDLRTVDLAEVQDRSPSALRRLAGGVRV
jgi:hypothetical protein